VAALSRIRPIGLLALLAAWGLTRLLPVDGVGLYLRLAAGTVLFLYPGAMVARALGRRSISATLAGALGLFAGAMGVMFLLTSSLWLALALYGLAGLVALWFASGRERPPRIAGSGWILVAGIVLGLALWYVAGALYGDALFHLARARKLLELGNLSLSSVNEFVDGGLHPGYAFPLWHGVLAAIARLAGVDPGSVVLHEASILAPLAVVVVYEAGMAVFRSVWVALAAVLAQVTLVALAPGRGGAFFSLALPASAARHLLMPAVIVLFFEQLDRPDRSGAVLLGAAGLALALVHPTYLIFVLLPLAGFVLVRALIVRMDLVSGLKALAALSVPGCLYLLALVPVVGGTAAHDPTADELERALTHYGTQIAHYAHGRYALSPEVLARSGTVAVAALVLTALAALASSRRWSAFVLGGALTVLALTLVPWLFMPFSDLVSISQSRRLGAFFPFAFALAGGLGVLARYLGRYVLLVAPAAGAGLQLFWPGDFGYGLREGGGPGGLVWVAAAACVVALAVALWRGRGPARERGGPIVAGAAALFVLPVALAGFAHWTPRKQEDRLALTPGLTAELRTQVPARAVVLADLATSYRILAAAPVYVVAAPPAHVADTNRNRPYQRRRDLLRFFSTGNLAIASRYKATWLVLRKGEAPALKLGSAPLYSDGTFSLYRLS
jgi:hypothetical protein